MFDGTNKDICKNIYLDCIGYIEYIETEGTTLRKKDIFLNVVLDEGNKTSCI